MAKVGTLWLSAPFWAVALATSIALPMLAMGNEVVNDWVALGVGVAVGATFPLVVRTLKTRSMRRSGVSPSARAGLPGLVYLAVGIGVGTLLGSFSVVGVGFLAGFCLANLTFQFTAEAARQREAFRARTGGLGGQG
jgi:hypothetical protein